MIFHLSYFWLGMLGMLLTLVSAAVLVYRLRHKTILLTAPIQLLAFCNLMILVHPIKYAPPSPIYYLAFLAIGLMMAAAAWVFSWKGPKPGTVQEQHVTRKIVKWGAIGSGLLISYVIWKVKQLSR
jgi:hypothetical protein